MGVKAFLSEHKKALGISLILFGVLWTADLLPSISIPLSYRVFGTFLLAAALGGYFVGSWLGVGEQEVNWHEIRQINAADREWQPRYELTPAAFEKMEVVGGKLNHLSEHSKPVYECRYYDDEHNIAHITWRGVPNDSELIGQRAGDICEEIDTMREAYEGPVRWGSAIRNGLPSIIRKLEFDRMQAQNAALDRHLTPDLGTSTIDELIEETIPDEALPDKLKSGSTPDDGPDPESSVSIDAVDDALEVAEDTIADEGTAEPVPGDD